MKDHPEIPMTRLIRFVVGDVDMTDKVDRLAITLDTEVGPVVDRFVVNPNVPRA